MKPVFKKQLPHCNKKPALSQNLEAGTLILCLVPIIILRNSRRSINIYININKLGLSFYMLRSAIHR